MVMPEGALKIEKYYIELRYNYKNVLQQFYKFDMQKNILYRIVKRLVFKKFCIIYFCNDENLVWYFQKSINKTLIPHLGPLLVP